MNKQELFDLISISQSKLDSLNDTVKEMPIIELTTLQEKMIEFQKIGLKLTDADQLLKIGIVGQVKAGKSSFLNSLFFEGESVLPCAATPMTAGLTVLEYSENNTFEIEYFNEEDWSLFVKQHQHYNEIAEECRKNMPDATPNVLKREIKNRTTESVRAAFEMVENCSDEARQKVNSPIEIQPFNNQEELQQVLGNYVGVNGQFTPVVKSLYIKMSDERLKGMRIVDTPGVNDPVISREERTRNFLQDCHGVFFLSVSAKFFDGADIHFLNNRIGAQGIGNVVLLASKFDSVLQDYGAQQEMNGTPPMPIEEATIKQLKSFEKRLEDLKDSVDATIKERIVLDFTSGISYSILHKSPECWETIEANVAQQMERYYPADFAIPEQQEKTYTFLANIKNIRQKHLEGGFVARQEEIIQDKLNGFVEQNSKNILEAIEGLSLEIQQKQEELENVTLRDIEEQKFLQQQLFENLSKAFASEIIQLNMGLQEQAEIISRKVKMPTIKIPTTNIEISFTHEGWLWGHSTSQTEIEIINSQKFKAYLETLLGDYCAKWNTEWKNFLSQRKKVFQQKIVDIILTAVAHIGRVKSFDANYYQLLTKRVLESLQPTLGLHRKAIKILFESTIDELVNARFEASDVSNIGKDSAKAKLKKEAQSFIQNVHLLIEAKFIHPLTAEINKQADKIIKPLIDEQSKLSHEFSAQLNSVANEYLSQLETTLQYDKDKNLQRIHKIEQELQDIKTLYNL